MTSTQELGPTYRAEVEKIPTESYIKLYNIESSETQEALRKYPVLCYLLGKVSQEPLTLTDETINTSTFSDRQKRQIFPLKEGSGMYGLKILEDAMRWKGIFNHIAGSARQIEYLAQLVTDFPEERKQVLIDHGFDRDSFQTLDPILLRDWQLVSHAGRRMMDEYNQDKLNDGYPHLSGESYPNTLFHLGRTNAPIELVNLMGIENHNNLEQEGAFTDISVAIATFGDWAFGQSTVTIDDRFKGFIKKINLGIEKRISLETAEKFRQAGNNFETALTEALGISQEKFYEEIANLTVPQWEIDIRKGFVSEAGLTLEEVYPEFAARIAA